MLRSVAGSVERGGVERAASNGAAPNGTVSNGDDIERGGADRPARLLLRGAGVVRGQAGDIAGVALVLTHFEHGDIT
jgi:hypothetical protein